MFSFSALKIFIIFIVAVLRFLFADSITCVSLGFVCINRDLPVLLQMFTCWMLDFVVFLYRTLHFVFSRFLQVFLSVGFKALHRWGPGNLYYRVTITSLLRCDSSEESAASCMLESAHISPPA